MCARAGSCPAPTSLSLCLSLPLSIHLRCVYSVASACRWTRRQGCLISATAVHICHTGCRKWRLPMQVRQRTDYTAGVFHGWQAHCAERRRRHDTRASRTLLSRAVAGWRRIAENGARSWCAGRPMLDCLIFRAGNRIDFAAHRVVELAQSQVLTANPGLLLPESGCCLSACACGCPARSLGLVLALVEALTARCRHAVPRQGGSLARGQQTDCLLEDCMAAEARLAASARVPLRCGLPAAADQLGFG